MLPVSIPWLGTPLRHKDILLARTFCWSSFLPLVCYLSGPCHGIEIDQNGGGDGYLQAQI